MLQALKAVKTKVFVIQGASLEANYKGVFSSNLGVDHSVLNLGLQYLVQFSVLKLIVFCSVCCVSLLSYRRVQ